MSFGIIVNIHTNHTTIVYSTLPFHLAAFPLIGPAFDNSFGLLLSLKRQNNQLRPLAGSVKIVLCSRWSRNVSFGFTHCHRSQVTLGGKYWRFRWTFRIVVRFGKVAVTILSSMISGGFYVCSPRSHSSARMGSNNVTVHRNGHKPQKDSPWTQIIFPIQHSP